MSRHGTRSGYMAHHRAGQEACNPEPHSYSCDRCGDMGYYSASGSWSADDDVPCSDCRAIGYESSPYGPDGDWGPES